jgi:hypothetical protein
MATFARAITEDGPVILDCAYNTELSVPLDDDQLFFVLSKEAHEKFDLSFGKGEVLIYSPKFETSLSCPWVGQAVDFEFIEY